MTNSGSQLPPIAEIVEHADIQWRKAHEHAQ